MALFLLVGDDVTNLIYSYKQQLEFKYALRAIKKVRFPTGSIEEPGPWYALRLAGHTVRYRECQVHASCPSTLPSHSTCGVVCDALEITSWPGVGCLAFYSVPTDVLIFDCVVRGYLFTHSIKTFIQ